MFALQVPEQVEVEQNARLEGPHDSQEKRNWQINYSIQGKCERGWCECIWWPPRTRFQLLPSYSSSGILGSTPYIPFLLRTPSPTNIPITPWTIDCGSSTLSWWRRWRTFLSHTVWGFGLSICFWHLSWILKMWKHPCTWYLASFMLWAQYYPWAMSPVKYTIIGQPGDLTIKSTTVSIGKLLEFQAKWQREFWTNIFKIRDCMYIKEG